MAIYEPQIALSDADREALALLAQLVLAAADGSGGHNLGCEAAPLSLSQARRLVILLEDLFSSKRFVEGCYFVEGVSNGKGWGDPRLREIYLSSRRRLGFTRVASTYIWNEFVVRVGFSASQNAWLWPRPGGARTVPMELEHFLKMERKLADTAELHPRVSALINEFLESRLPQIQRVRDHELSLPDGTMRLFAGSFLAELKRVAEGNEEKPISKRKLIAISTLVMDVGALFITRDWTATGTMSMIGATLPDLVE
jgi:hypothetical protein